MEKKIVSKNTFILSVIVCLLPMVLGIAFLIKLPDQIPIHFGTNNVAHQYTPKLVALLGIPIFMAIVQAICLMLTPINKVGKKTIVMSVLVWLLPIITNFVYCIMISKALGSELNVNKVVCFVVGIIFMVIGNYLPKMSYETGKQILHPLPRSEKAFRIYTKTFSYAFLGIGIFLLFAMIRA